MIYRVILGLFVWLVAIPPAESGQIDRSYQAVMQVREVHAKPVLDNKSHLLGIGAFRGLAIFSDGEIAVHRYEGWFDLIGGTGKFHGHALWLFDDASEIRARYDGAARQVTANDIEVEVLLTIVSGTGRYRGASGGGKFAGRRLEAIDKGGSTYLKGSLNITVP